MIVGLALICYCRKISFIYFIDEHANNCYMCIILLLLHSYLWSSPRANIEKERLNDDLIELKASNFETTAEFTVTVWSGKRNASQIIKITNSDKIKAK